MKEAFEYLAKTWWGMTVIVLVGLALAWILGEFALLSGDKIHSDYLGYNSPLKFTTYTPDVRFRVVIQSRTKKAKRRLRYKIMGPDTTLAVNGQDGYRRQTRAFYFNAAIPGDYALVIDDFYKPGGDDLPPQSARYINAKWVDVYEDDKTKILGKLQNYFVLW